MKTLRIPNKIYGDYCQLSGDKDNLAEFGLSSKIKECISLSTLIFGIARLWVVGNISDILFII
jgi:hypothetical protein